MVKKTNNHFEQESGRSMVEMLGVLAIIGVLSVGGISGYTTAMNKHKANEILNAAAVRAMAVSTQLQNGAETPSLGEFTGTSSVGGATFDDEGTITSSGGKFTIGFTNNGKPSEAVLKQMEQIAGTDGIVRKILDGGLVYNDDLSTDVRASDFNGDTSKCVGPKYHLCSGSDRCLDVGVDCSETCVKTSPECQECNDLGGISAKNEGGDCTTSDNKEGVCTSGECVEKPTCEEGRETCSGGAISGLYPSVGSLSKCTNGVWEQVPTDTGTNPYESACYGTCLTDGEEFCSGESVSGQYPRPGSTFKCTNGVWKQIQITDPNDSCYGTCPTEGQEWCVGGNLYSGSYPTTGTYLKCTNGIWKQVPNGTNPYESTCYGSCTTEGEEYCSGGSVSGQYPSSGYHLKCSNGMWKQVSNNDPYDSCYGTCMTDGEEYCSGGSVSGQYPNSGYHLKCTNRVWKQIQIINPDDSCYGSCLTDGAEYCSGGSVSGQYPSSGSHYKCSNGMWKPDYSTSCYGSCLTDGAEYCSGGATYNGTAGQSYKCIYANGYGVWKQNTTGSCYGSCATEGEEYCNGGSTYSGTPGQYFKCTDTGGGYKVWKQNTTGSCYGSCLTEEQEQCMSNKKYKCTNRVWQMIGSC